MLEKLAELFQGNESHKMIEADSCNLPGLKGIGEQIIEAAKEGRYDWVIPLNDDKLWCSRPWHVEEHYQKYSPKYQKLSRTLKEAGYRHYIIEFDKNDYYTGLHLYISWKFPGEKAKTELNIIEAIDAKRISDSHIKNKINHIELEKIKIKIIETPVKYYPIEVDIDHLNQNELSELIDHLENRGFTHGLVYSRKYNKYVMQVKW